MRDKTGKLERELSDVAGRLNKAIENNSNLQMMNKDYEVK